MAMGSAICGIIIAIIGQELLKKTNTNINGRNNDNLSCTIEDKKISYSEYNGLITGYSIIAFSIFFIMILSSTNKGNGGEYLISKMLKMSLPSFITLGCIVYIIVLYSYHKNSIVSGIIVDEFNSYTLGINILIIFQIILLGYYTVDVTRNKTKYMVYLICLIIIILIGTQQSKLQYFSTDG
jgi:hypothetical protein